MSSLRRVLVVTQVSLITVFVALSSNGERLRGAAPLLDAEQPTAEIPAEPSVATEADGSATEASAQGFGWIFDLLGFGGGTDARGSLDGEAMTERSSEEGMAQPSQPDTAASLDEPEVTSDAAMQGQSAPDTAPSITPDVSDTAPDAAPAPAARSAVQTDASFLSGFFGVLGIGDDETPARTETDADSLARLLEAIGIGPDSGAMGFPAPQSAVGDIELLLGGGLPAQRAAQSAPSADADVEDIVRFVNTGAQGAVSGAAGMPAQPRAAVDAAGLPFLNIGIGAVIGVGIGGSSSSTPPWLTPGQAFGTCKGDITLRGAFVCGDAERAALSQLNGCVEGAATACQQRGGSFYASTNERRAYWVGGSVLTNSCHYATNEVNWECRRPFTGLNNLPGTCTGQGTAWTCSGADSIARGNAGSCLTAEYIKCLGMGGEFWPQGAPVYSTPVHTGSWPNCHSTVTAAFSCNKITGGYNGTSCARTAAPQCGGNCPSGWTCRQQGSVCGCAQQGAHSSVAFYDSCETAAAPACGATCPGENMHCRALGNICACQYGSSSSVRITPVSANASATNTSRSRSRSSSSRPRSRSSASIDPNNNCTTDHRPACEDRTCADVLDRDSGIWFKQACTRSATGCRCERTDRPALGRAANAVRQ